MSRLLKSPDDVYPALRIAKIVFVGHYPIISTRIFTHVSSGTVIPISK